MTTVRIPELTFGVRLRLAREQAQLSQAEIAPKVDASTRTVIRWESGETVPSRLVIREWARICGVPVDWLRGRDSNPQPTAEAKHEEALERLRQDDAG
jgi:transcriptional regulator with XRE-family HTH domain